MSDVSLRCRCGNVTGRVRDVNPADGTRVVCYCQSCQEFARHLAAGGRVVDEWGGTEIYQVPPARVELLSGLEHVRCVRLTPKGLFRWYAGCCQTPLANTVSAAVPLVGLISSFAPDRGFDDERFGPLAARVNMSGATGRLPPDKAQQISSLGYGLKVLRLLLWWKLSGRGRPTPFFDAAGAPLSEPEVLSDAAA